MLSRKVRRGISRRQLVVTSIVLNDGIVAALSFLLAYAAMAGLSVTAERAQGTGETRLLVESLTVLVVYCSIFYLASIPHRVWRHVSMGDFIAIALASMAATSFFVLIASAAGDGGMAISVALTQLSLTVLILSAQRILWRLACERLAARDADGLQRSPVLLVGPEASCGRLLRMIAGDTSISARPIGLLLTGRADVGRRMLGAPVLGKARDLASVLEGLSRRQIRPKQVIVTQDVAFAVRERVIEDAARCGVPATLLSGRALLAGGEAGATPICEFPLQALLGRGHAAFDRKTVAALVAGRRVLVTGAGGSIGSEITRILCTLGPARLALIDSSEFNLYTIDQELGAAHPEVPREKYLADVRLYDRIAQIFREERPDFVFHAAALKHVPMVELNPTEGVLSNIVGSRNVADAARACGVRALVQVSTDKAVNPTSIMGATKRLAELYCQALDLERGAETDGAAPRFMTVRFGNVLGSSGSVVPLFSRQIAEGGPVTVTHPDIRRFFMTIEEASGLVLQACAQGLRETSGRGEIFVLDMGEQIRIVDLARQMVRLMGKDPDRDVGIEFVGLRPGEKLYEELFDDTELRVPGPAEGLLVARSTPFPLPVLEDLIRELERHAFAGDAAMVRQLLARAVPRSSQAGDEEAAA